MANRNPNPRSAWGRSKFRCETLTSIPPPSANAQFADESGKPHLTLDVPPPPLQSLVQLTIESLNPDQESVLVRTLDGDTIYGWLTDGQNWKRSWGLLRQGYRVVGGFVEVAEEEGGWNAGLIWWVGSKFRNAQEERFWLAIMALGVGQ